MNIFPVFFAAAKIGIGRGPFYFATTKIRIGRGPLLRQGQAPLRRLFTSDYAAFVASCSRLRPHDFAAGGPFYDAATALRRRNCSICGKEN